MKKNELIKGKVIEVDGVDDAVQKIINKNN